MRRDRALASTFAAPISKPTTGAPRGQRRSAKQQDGEEAQEGHQPPAQPLQHVRPAHAAGDGGDAEGEVEEQVSLTGALTCSLRLAVLVEMQSSPF